MNVEKCRRPSRSIGRVLEAFFNGCELRGTKERILFFVFFLSYLFDFLFLFWYEIATGYTSPMLSLEPSTLICRSCRKSGFPTKRLTRPGHRGALWNRECVLGCSRLEGTELWTPEHRLLLAPSGRVLQCSYFASCRVLPTSRCSEYRTRGCVPPHRT